MDLWKGQSYLKISFFIVNESKSWNWLPNNVWIWPHFKDSCGPWSQLTTTSQGQVIKCRLSPNLLNKQQKQKLSERYTCRKQRGHGLYGHKISSAVSHKDMLSIVRQMWLGGINWSGLVRKKWWSKWSLFGGEAVISQYDGIPTVYIQCWWFGCGEQVHL